MSDVTWVCCLSSALCASASASTYSHRLKEFYIGDRMNWTDAQAYCRCWGTDLVTMHSQEEAAEQVGNITLANEDENFWTGLHRSTPWSNGDVHNYTNWRDKGHENEMPCARMLTDGEWEAVHCSIPSPFVCYDKDLIHLVNETKTWEGALNQCDAEYKGGLLRIESEQEQRSLEEFLGRQRITGPVWLGLRQSRLFSSWIWASGHAVQWSNWEGGRQPEQTLSHICGAIATSGPEKFKWSNQNCLSESYFLYPTFEGVFPHVH
ncbi:hypothetical protein AAFF_G00161770 [Aldrovandia affinis]|uniref:C-type lectin domain-containing protein n=1 Tax=Aldrovandia affinis TaxID=143900 RepID=A0AAD7W872_9TELE|nr:hypothetical protein AAFF_G00161770 [Aldrovandia affinis]